MLGVEPFNGGAPPDEYDEGNIYSVDPFGDVDGNFLGFERLRDVMVDHGDNDLPIYITLFGYSTAGNKNPGVDDVTRAGYLTEALELATCRPYVGALSWYALHPNPWDPPPWTLLDAKGRESQTYDALVAWPPRTGDPSEVVEDFSAFSEQDPDSGARLQELCTREASGGGFA